MDCLLCCTVVITELGFGNSSPQPEDKNTILELFGISDDPNVQGLSEELVICSGCHGMLEEVRELLKRVDEEKIIIRNELVKSKEISDSKLMTTGGLDRSKIKSSLDRLILLKAIDSSGNPAAQGVGSGAMEVQDENDDVNIESGGIDGIDENHEEIPAQHDEIELVQGPSRSSAKSKCNLEKSKNDEAEETVVPSQSKSKAGYALRKPAQKRSFYKESSDEKSSSESESDIDEPETEVEGSISSNGSAEVYQANGEVPSGSSKAGHVLRKREKEAEKRSFYKESSDEGSDSESESGEGFSSEDDNEIESKSSIGSNGSGVGQRGNAEVGTSSNGSGIDQEYGNQRGRAKGILLKEFTRLENGSYQCNHCPSIIRKNISAHFLIHNPNAQFKCSVQDCGKRFAQKYARDEHVKNVHEKRRDFQCRWAGCNKWFSVKKSLNIHVKNIHESRDFKCGICGKTFAINQQLLKHISIKHRAAKKMDVARAISLHPSRQ